MNTRTLSCRHCGALLPIAEAQRFMTCDYCSTQLEVVAKDDALCTEIVRDLQQKTQSLAVDVGVMKLRAELAALDDDFERYRRDHLARGQDGAPVTPSTVGSIVLGTMLLVLAGAGVAFIQWIPAVSSLWLLAPAAIALLGVYGMFVGSAQAKRYERRLAVHQRERAELSRRIVSAETQLHEP